MQITKGQAAFATVTVLAAATAGSVFAAVATVSKAAQIAYGVLGITCGGASIASITAYFDPQANTASEYFNAFKDHAGIAIAGTYQFASQVLLQAFIKGLADGVSIAIRRAIAGPDITFSQV